MKLGVFVSDYRITVETLDRLQADSLGIILVSSGIYHACVKENGKASDILAKPFKFYVLKEDVVTRGFDESSVDSRVKVITYSDLVDLIFNEYEKLAWL